MTQYLRSVQFWITLTVIVLLALLPYTLSFYMLGVLTIAYIFSGFAMSWDLLFGYSGEVNFGPTFFIGVGAYVAALLNVYTGLGVWPCVILGAFAAVIAGLLMVAPALRLRGPYFGIITLVSALILEKLIVTFAGVTGGEIGLSVPNVLSISTWMNYYYAFIFMLVSGLILFLVSRSPIGLILEASGQDPIATQALGINIIKYKILGFMLSAFISGWAGAMMIFYFGTASISTVVAISVTLQVIISTILGGRRSIVGPALGAIFIIVANEELRPLGQLNNVAVALVVLIILLSFPDGFIGLVHKFRRRGA